MCGAHGVRINHNRHVLDTLYEWYMAMFMVRNDKQNKNRVVMRLDNVFKYIDQWRGPK